MAVIPVERRSPQRYSLPVEEHTVHHDAHLLRSNGHRRFPYYCWSGKDDFTLLGVKESYDEAIDDPGWKIYFYLRIYVFYNLNADLIDQMPADQR